jgi:reactive chlorine resistance protein C
MTPFEREAASMASDIQICPGVRRVENNYLNTRAGQYVERAGQIVAFVSVVLPLLMIGGLKFTDVEVEALKPLIQGTPWLAWVYGAFGHEGATYLLGMVEITTAVFLLASPWSVRAGVAGASLACVIFAVTSSLMLALPIWDERLGGFPALNGAGQFLIKDLALLGISISILSRNLIRLSISALPSDHRSDDAAVEAEEKLLA